MKDWSSNLALLFVYSARLVRPFASLIDNVLRFEILSVGLLASVMDGIVLAMGIVVLDGILSGSVLATGGPNSPTKLPLEPEAHSKLCFRDGGRESTTLAHDDDEADAELAIRPRCAST